MELGRHSPGRNLPSTAAASSAAAATAPASSPSSSRPPPLSPQQPPPPRGARPLAPRPDVGSAVAYWLACASLTASGDLLVGPASRSSSSSPPPALFSPGCQSCGPVASTNQSPLRCHCCWQAGVREGEWAGVAVGRREALLCHPQPDLASSPAPRTHTPYTPGRFGNRASSAGSSRSV